MAQACIPLLFGSVYNECRPVASILTPTKCRAHLRTALYAQLVREFAQGRSWRQRTAFLEICSSALRRFSQRFCKVRHSADIGQVGT